MSCETFSETINEMEVSYTQLPARKSLKLKYRIIGIAGSAIGDLTLAMGKSDGEQMAAFTSALQNIFSDNDPDAVLALMEEILKPVFINGDRADIDRDFTGHLEKMYSVVFWVLRKEYGNFIQGLESLMQE